MPQRFRERNTYVSGNTPKENHGYHDAEEHNDDQRIDETEPMNAGVENMQIVIPTSSLEQSSASCIK